MDKENPMNYFRNLCSEVSPDDFERLCLDLLQNLEGFSALNDVTIEHDKLYIADDGEYQLDGYIEYIVMGVKMKVIVECKRHKNAIKREVVSVLHNKIISVGANKGILMSTSGFQFGAVKYAQKHGIALLQVVNGTVLTIQNSARPSTLSVYHKYPKHVVMMYDLNMDFPMYRLPNDNDILQAFLQD